MQTGKRWPILSFRNVRYYRYKPEAGSHVSAENESGILLTAMTTTAQGTKEVKGCTEWQDSNLLLSSFSQAPNLPGPGVPTRKRVFPLCLGELEQGWGVCHLSQMCNILSGRCLYSQTLRERTNKTGSGSSISEGENVPGKCH
jgi:hypothetical protein